MRIVVENSGYHLLNLGDVAMLQVATRRLRSLWPGAELFVPTTAPDELARHCPGTIPLNAHGRTLWLREGNVFGGAARCLPPPLRAQVARLERYVRRRSPRALRGRITRQIHARNLDPRAMNEYLDAVLNADLIVGGGGGYLTDAFFDQALGVMETLALGVSLGIPTALLGQGIGPVEREQLLRPMRRLLPRLDLIALREQRAGLPLLRSLGVRANRVMTTGDDAIEAAIAPLDESGGSSTAPTGIGVNLRATAYAQVPLGAGDKVREALVAAVNRWQAPLVPLPVSRYDNGEDARAIAALIPDPGSESPASDAIDTPSQLIGRIARCRMVVTGSYHAGVFALARGIPVVGLARSRYYVDKLLGLADQFGIGPHEGAGCEMVMLDAPDLAARLKDAMERAWSAADEIAPKLRSAAQRQVEQSRRAYQRLAEICGR